MKTAPRDNVETNSMCHCQKIIEFESAFVRESDISGRYGPGTAGAGIAAGIVAGSVIGATSGYYGGPRDYDNSYAYDDGYGGGYDNGYAVRNGFVCQPGTVFRGEDGRPHLCQ